MCLQLYIYIYTLYVYNRKYIYIYICKVYKPYPAALSAFDLSGLTPFTWFVASVFEPSEFSGFIDSWVFRTSVYHMAPKWVHHH